jgi:hypothetical protein
MIYHFSGRKRWITVLLAGLVVVVLLGLWFRNSIGGRSMSTLPPSLSKIAYGVNVDITAMIPDSGYTVRTADGGNFFDLAAQLGINTLRITDVRWTNTGKVRSKATWDYVFNQAEKHHMNIILMLINVYDDSEEQSALREAHTLLGDYDLAHAPALWMVDLYNEPDLSDPLQMTELREEAAYVHKVAPRVPVTIGGWKTKIPEKPGKFDWQDPADIPKLIDLVDVVSPHLYGFEQDAQHGISPAQSTRKFLQEVREESQGKPILLEEFGASNGLGATEEFGASNGLGATTDLTPLESPQWQASVYRGVLQEVLLEHDQGVVGAVAWIMAPRPVIPSSPSNMIDYAFVLNHGQHLLPAAHVFSSVQRIVQINQLEGDIPS